MLIMESCLSELNSTNLEERLATDATLVDYFNTFLSLPCFPQRIFYNKELNLLEQFSQKLVKDENDNVQVSSKPQRIKNGYKTVQISYCATVLDKVIGFKWLKKYRLQEFLKSKLYAEYKLSKVLSDEQAKYIEAIKNDIEKSKEYTVENQKHTLQKLIKTACVENGEKHEENDVISNDDVKSHDVVDHDVVHTNDITNNHVLGIDVLSNEVMNGSDVGSVDVINGSDVTNDYSSDVIIDDVVVNDVTESGNESDEKDGYKNSTRRFQDDFLSIRECGQDIKNTNERNVDVAGQIVVKLNQSEKKLRKVEEGNINDKRVRILGFRSSESNRDVDSKNVTKNKTEKGAKVALPSREDVAKNSAKSGGLRSEMEEKQVVLSTKDGMDRLKEFLTNTKAECLFLFWIEVELWKCENTDNQKTKIIQDIKDTFLRNGSPFELPYEIRKQANLLMDDLSETQHVAIAPLHTYWCPRFTLHQLRRCVFGKEVSYTLNNSYASQTRRACSDSIPHENIIDIPSLNEPRIVRPHSSTLPERCERVKNSHIRSKSANPRIITTPYHTNAGHKQLELYATPPPIQYGFYKRSIESFPAPDDQDYISPVRLLINPLSKPEPRKAWLPSPNNAQSCQENSKINTRLPQESLVDALTHNSETGSFFKEFIEKQNNKLWKDCLALWQAVMEYNTYFDSVVLNPDLVKRKAQWIYTTFILPGSACCVQLDSQKRGEIERNLDPPYEEVFDTVEEHVLKCLKEPWESLCRSEHREYDMVPKQETLRYLEVDVKHRKDQSENFGLLDQSDDYDEAQKEHGKYGIEEANSPWPVPSDGVTFESIIKDREDLEGFQKFLEKKDPNAVKDLMAWTDMETFQRIPNTMAEKRNKKAKDIRQAYLNRRYFFGPDSPATKEAQNLTLSINGASRINDIPSASVISECQKYVRCRIERRWLALYKESQEYKDKQNPKHQISEAVEDIMLRRRLQRSEAAWRILNSRWVSSSRDIVALRQTLNSPESCLAFRKFVALKGETYENDVLFWIEVQKYKDLCHRHASEKCVKKKIQAIMDCFITSSIPPELQIDVPIEMAEKLIERVTSRNQTIGPYLFRETQMIVFRVLFNLWKEFCTYRSTVMDDNLLQVLEKKLKHHRTEVIRKREATERRRLARQEAERKKKEKEEKERKDLKSVEQLVSLMTEPSLWDREEEDVVFWRYSKHVAGPDRKRSVFDGASSFITFTNQPSMGTKSTFNITNKGNSKASTIFKSHGSMVTNSLYSNESKYSKKLKKSKNLLVPRVHETASSPGSEEPKMTQDQKTELAQNKKSKRAHEKALLKNTRQKEAKTTTEIGNISLQEQMSKVSGVKSTHGGKSPRAKSPVKADLTKRDGVVVNQHDIVSVGKARPNIGRVQSNEKQDRIQSPTLTSELLQDFTNSPEGAPLDFPLPLIRINDPQNNNKEQQISPRRQQLKIKRSWDKNGRLILKREQNHITDYIPDVIVN